MCTPSDLETITLETDTLGTLRGTIVNVNGKRIARFLGIPYAKPPVGKLRFKPLEALEGPLGTSEAPFEALEVGRSAIQIKTSVFGTSLQKSEDCIFLNIWVPLQEGQDLEKLKVRFCCLEK